MQIASPPGSASTNCGELFKAMSRGKRGKRGLVQFAVRGPKGVRLMRSIPVLIRSFLEKDGDFTMPKGMHYHGLSLPPEVLTKIYTANFERIYGAAPMPLNPTTMKQ